MTPTEQQNERLCELLGWTRREIVGGGQTWCDSIEYQGEWDYREGFDDRVLWTPCFDDGHGMWLLLQVLTDKGINVALAINRTRAAAITADFPPFLRASDEAPLAVRELALAYLDREQRMNRIMEHLP